MNNLLWISEIILLMFMTSYCTLSFFTTINKYLNKNQCKYSTQTSCPCPIYLKENKEPVLLPDNWNPPDEWYDDPDDSDKLPPFGKPK